jgi:hypothetical protein
LSLTIEQEITRQLAAGKRIVVIDADAFPSEQPDLSRELLTQAQEKEREARRAESLSTMLLGKGDTEGGQRQRFRADDLLTEARYLRHQVQR